MVKMESRNAFQMTIAAHSVHILRLFFLYAIAKAGASIKIKKKFQKIFENFFLDYLKKRKNRFFTADFWSFFGDFRLMDGPNSFFLPKSGRPGLCGSVAGKI